MTKKERYTGIINWFEQNMPVVDTELHYDNPFHLLIAVILSAQCTDKRVNMVTPPLFEAYPAPEVMAVSSSDAIYEYIKSVSYPNNKAKNLLGMAKKLVSDFDGQVPHTLEELESIPGVGRKTANVMLIVAFNKPAMPVDTHVFRVSNRLGLTDNSKNPVQTEQELIKYIPAKYLSRAHHWLILHGRYVCVARKPKCEECGLTPYCKYFSKNR
ncbi:MAG: endonuclease III [Prevotella sp.]|jgi:endonuclease-3|nr:endonuclease III [Prevotella sp.]